MYTAQTWQNGGAPALSAANLQALDDRIVELGQKVIHVNDGTFGTLTAGASSGAEAANTATIQSAIDYAFNNDIGTVILPHGYYEVITLDFHDSASASRTTGAEEHDLLALGIETEIDFKGLGNTVDIGVITAQVPVTIGDGIDSTNQAGCVIHFIQMRDNDFLQWDSAVDTPDSKRPDRSNSIPDLLFRDPAGAVNCVDSRLFESGILHDRR